MTLVLWRGIEEWLAEAAWVRLTPHGVWATGTQLGADPHPYRADYRLDASADWITRTLEIEVTTAGGTRGLRLEHDGAGEWRANREPLEAVRGARDCDLAYSPLTNLMPVRRHGLHEGGEPREFLMAWVSLPDLAVTPAPQRYEPIRPGAVRFVALDGDFRAELELDADGLVRFYPQLARRVGPEER